MAARKQASTDSGNPSSSEPERRGKAFGHQGKGYGEQGLGYPGADEQREGEADPHAKHTVSPDDAEPERDDEDAGYSQDSGYAQSGGTRPERPAEPRKPENGKPAQRSTR